MEQLASSKPPPLPRVEDNIGSNRPPLNLGSSVVEVQEGAKPTTPIPIHGAAPVTSPSPPLPLHDKGHVGNRLVGAHGVQKTILDYAERKPPEPAAKGR